MRAAFGWDLERFVLFGGYPGAAPLVDDVERWRSYILDSLIETTLSRDVLLLNRVDKPALFRQLFRLGCDYSAQVVAYNKLVGQLQDAGNTTTLAHYLRLLRDAGLLAGLEKFSGSQVRQRGSSPKLLALDTGLVTAMSGLDPVAIRSDGATWGRLVETAVGAHLVNTAGRGPGRDVVARAEPRGRLHRVGRTAGRRRRGTERTEEGRPSWSRRVHVRSQGSTAAPRRGTGPAARAGVRGRRVRSPGELIAATLEPRAVAGWMGFLAADG